MATKEVIGMVVRAFNGGKCEHEQEFLYKDITPAEADEKARIHHKHIRDLHPNYAVELTHLFKD